ncbi:MAG: tetratricopeptide repeat protein [Bacteroidales bacterium]|nr:tetratricopeptide repeat protein [Bacteroidales bacterium]
MTIRHIFAAIILAIAPYATHAAEPVDSTDYDADPYFILTGEADAAIAEQNWPEAAARLADAIAVRPDAATNPLLINNLATVYTYMGLDSLALATYDRALEAAPSMVTTRLGRGKLLLRMGRDIDAFHEFDSVLDIDSLSTDACYYHGMIALYAGNREMAEHDFDVMHRVAPQAYDTALALATLYSLTGRDRQAIPYLEKLIEADPSAEFFASLAGCHLALGDLTEASAVITRGMKSFPDDPELYYYRAWLNRDRYRLDDAREDARKAIDLGASPIKVNELFNK